MLSYRPYSIAGSHGSATFFIEQLKLTKKQSEKTEEIQIAMSSEAKRLGKEFVEKERELDRLFAGG